MTTDDITCLLIPEDVMLSETFHSGTYEVLVSFNTSQLTCERIDKVSTKKEKAPGHENTGMTYYVFDQILKVFKYYKCIISMLNIMNY